jgi:hypothetical protein
MIKQVSVLFLLYVECLCQIKVITNWNNINPCVTSPTLQIVINPLFRRTSKIHNQVVSLVKNLNVDMVRFAGWLPYPRLSVAELEPPQCQNNNKTFWNLDLLDPILDDFFSVTSNGTRGYLSMSTSPQWMWKTDKPVPYPNDPDQPYWQYTQGTELVDPSGKQIADYFVRLVQYYGKGGFTDECGTFHSSSRKYKLPLWEVFNEIEAEHSLSVEKYTTIYDVINLAVREEFPDMKFMGLALGTELNQTQRLAYINYFLNISNHKPGVTLDYISYHFYGIPDDKQPLSTWGDQMFDQADIFVKNSAEIQKIKSKLSPKTKVAINEQGVLLWSSATQDIPSPIPDLYWNIGAAHFAYTYLKLARIGIDVVGMSQLIGNPKQFPSVSMVNWEDGRGNARYWALKLISDHLSLRLGSRKVFMAATLISGAAPIEVQSFIVEEEGMSKKLTLVINKSMNVVQWTVDGDGTGEYLDQTTGPYGSAKKFVFQANKPINLAAYGVSVLVYNE